MNQANPQTNANFTPDQLAFLASLTDAQRDALLNEVMRTNPQKIKRSGAKMTFSQFKAKFWRNYKPAPYDAAIDAVLQGVADYVLSGGKKGIQKAWILTPPRHGKTQRVHRLFPAWLLSQMPSLPIIAASYGMRLAEKNTRWVRNLIQRRDYQELFPNVRLLGTASDQWETDQEGGMMAAGIGASITGFGALLGLIDDPTRSRADAESDLKREKQKDWYTDDFLTRVEEPGGAILGTATLWHQDDLPSWLIAGNEDEDDAAEQWHVLRLPALAEENDPIGRAPGDALWPERYPVKWLEKRRDKMGDYGFAALYQQRPAPSAGGIIKTELITRIDAAQLPTIQRKIRAYDLAMSEKTHADYTASVLMGIGDDGRHYILDVTRQRVDWSNLVEYLMKIILLDGTNVQHYIEKKGYMSKAIEALNADPRMRGYAIFGHDVDGDKVTRALPFASRVGAGMVSILNRHFVDKYFDELGAFPYADHDDQVDATSLAYTCIDILSEVFAFVGDSGYVSPLHNADGLHGVRLY